MTEQLSMIEQLSMTEQLEQITIEEIYDGLLSGRRDFSKRKLVGNRDLAGYDDFDKLQEYLRIQNLQENPIIFSYSQFVGLIVPELHLPGVMGFGVNLSEADLRGANLFGAKLLKAYFTKADLREANLEVANLEGANLSEADLEGAKLLKADLTEANFREANIKNVKGLNDVWGLNRAYFYSTRLTTTEKKIIDDKEQELKRFVVDDS